MLLEFPMFLPQVCQTVHRMNIRRASHTCSVYVLDQDINQRHKEDFFSMVGNTNVIWRSIFKLFLHIKTWQMAVWPCKEQYMYTMRLYDIVLCSPADNTHTHCLSLHLSDSGAEHTTDLATHLYPLQCLCHSPWHLFCRSHQRAAGGLIVTPVTMCGCHCQTVVSLPCYHPKAQQDDITPRHWPPHSTTCYP